MPAVSVILPVYQVRKYLRPCLESILQQSCHDFELIIVDDGSTDGSGKICDEYAGKADYIQVIHQENQGLGAARNRGIEVAKGIYIVFIDSDDYIGGDMLEGMLNEIEAKQADLLICDYFTDDEGKILRKQQLDANYCWMNSSFMQYVANEQILSFAWNKLYRRYLFDDIRYPEKRIFEDQYIFHHLAQKARRIAYTTNAYYYYRINTQGLSRSFVTRNAYDCFRADIGRSYFIKKYYPQYEADCWKNVINNACNTYWRYLFTGQGKEYANIVWGYLHRYGLKYILSARVPFVVKLKIFSVFFGIDKIKWQERWRKMRG